MSVVHFDGDRYGDTSGFVYGYNNGETDVCLIEDFDRSCSNLSKILVNATTQLLGNTLSHSTPQIKLTAKENRLTKRSGCLNTFCFFPDRNKRLPSESPCSVSRSCVQARRDMTTNRMSPNTDPTAKIDANSTTATR